MAADILERLHAEHQNFARFLYCFRHQISGFGNPDEETNISLILDMLDYINAYPERWHHPVEDIIFARLLTKEFDQKAVVESVMEDHQKLETLTDKLRADFGSVVMDVAIHVEELKAEAQDYLDAQFAHLDIEEGEIYPLVEEHFDDSDWAELEEQLRGEEDPLFDQTRNQYDHLLSAITSFETGLDRKYTRITVDEDLD